MKLIVQIFLAISFCFPALVSAQNELIIRVLDAEEETPIPLANILIVGTQIGAATDTDGYATLKGLTGSSIRIKVTMLGYETFEQTISLPANSPIIIMLEHHHDELEEVTVSATRGSRLIEKVPTRVEVIAGEELEEKGNMNSSNITMLLRETPGIQVQQTDATSGNMSFRIQGLDGRYTQLLQDGMPIYGGVAGSLSLVQIPPLNLKQVEIIKGSASTLYGGGAIAGLVNLVTKTYEDEGTSLMLNALSTGGADVNFFSGGMIGSLGYTAFVTGVSQNDYDSNDDGFADIPKSRRLFIEPKLWFPVSDETELYAGFAYTNEDRTGGFVGVDQPSPIQNLNYVEELSTQRMKYLFGVKSNPVESTTIEFKNVLSKTIINQSDSYNHGLESDQTNIFSEISASIDNDKSEIIIGISFLQEELNSLFTRKSDNPSTILLQKFTLKPERVIGFFGQNVLDVNPKLTLETGVRLDVLTKDQAFFMPRVNLMYKWNSKFTSRLGGGTGYKSVNSVVQEYPETVWHDMLVPGNAILLDNRADAERSIGFNADLDYKTIIGENVTLSLNHLLFYTRINDPILVGSGSYRTVTESPSAPGNRTYLLSNRDGFLHSRGTETNVKLSYKQLKLYQYYTYTAVNFDGESTQLLLTPKHRMGSVLMLEEHESYRIGFEAYYTGSQKLSDNSSTSPYMIFGIMAEKSWERISLFVNFENFTDTRMDNRMVMSASHPNRESEIYAPTDGRIINGGFKVRF